MEIKIKYLLKKRKWSIKLVENDIAVEKQLCDTFKEVNSIVSDWKSVYKIENSSFL